MTVRIGYFPSNNSLFVLRHRGIVEQRIPDVEWVDFRSLPAQRVGVRDGLPTAHADHLFTTEGYDFIGTGFTPPITGLGQGHDLAYVGVSEPRVENGRLVARQGTGITSVSDLRGRRIGIAHGSWQTTLLLFALHQAGLRWADVEPIDIGGIDAARALADGEIDAWTGSYPELGDLEKTTELVTLVNTDGVFSHPSLWFTRRDFAENRLADVRVIVESLQESDAWIAAHPREAAQYFVDDAQRRGATADLDAWTHALAGRPFGIHPISESFLDEQQRAADLLYQEGLLPRQISVRAAVISEIAEIITQSRRVA